MPERTNEHRWRRRAADAALVLFVVVLAGLQLTPAENEAHYLALARHYWQPSWCAGDALLESAPIHRVFYLSFGWVAAACSLETAARIGRLVTWCLLALAWQRLSYAVAPRPGWACVSMALAALGNQYGHLSGEWLIGGVEAKTFAYPLVLAGLAAWLNERIRAALLFLSAATAWHPLVGGWAVLAWSIAAFVTQPAARREFRSARGAMVLPIAVALCLAGLLPPVLADLHTPAATRSIAWRIMVQQRVPHHLLPWAFGWQAWLGFGAVLAVGIGLFRSPTVSNLPLPPGEGRGEGAAASSLPIRPWQRMLNLWARPSSKGEGTCTALSKLVTFTAVALALSAIGLALAVATRPWPAVQSSLLRFYWFRQVGVMAPVCTALVATVWLYQKTDSRPWARSAIAVILWGAVLALNPSRTAYTPLSERDTPLDRFYSWEDACAWINRNAPADAVFITPRLRQTFKWYAQRAEVATWKDVPQDAAHVVPWWRRLLDLHTVETPSGREWIKSLTQHSPERLRALGERYGAEYLICGSQPVLNLPCLYRHDHYAVYRLAPEPPAP